MKTLTYDPTDHDSMMKALNKLKSDVGQLKSLDAGSRTSRENAIYCACSAIVKTDISQVYGFDSVADRREHYVYVHCDPTKPVHGQRLGLARFLSDLQVDYWPFYVGKGIGNRSEILDRNETHRKVRQMILTLGKEVQVRKVKTGLTERQALALESKLIDIFGLRPTGGLLVNLDEGVSPVERRKLYSQHLSTVSPFYKQIFSPNEKLERRQRYVASV